MFNPPTDAYSTEIVTRRAPRWAWDVIDQYFAGDTLSEEEASAALKAMCDASEERA